MYQLLILSFTGFGLDPYEEEGWEMVLRDSEELLPTLARSSVELLPALARASVPVLATLGRSSIQLIQTLDRDSSLAMSRGRRQRVIYLETIMEEPEEPEEPVHEPQPEVLLESPHDNTLARLGRAVIQAVSPSKEATFTLALSVVGDLVWSFF